MVPRPGVRVTGSEALAAEGAVCAETVDTSTVLVFLFNACYPMMIIADTASGGNTSNN